jgi:hypothetical protein
VTEKSTPYKRAQIELLIARGWRRVPGDKRHWQSSNGVVATRARAAEMQKYWDDLIADA